MFKIIAGAVCLVFIAVSMYGCAALIGATAGGAGTAFWLSGKLSDTVNAPYKRTIDATKAAFKSLKLEIDKETYKEDVTQIIGKYTDGRKVWVDIRPLTENASKVEIRVGVKGDKSESAKILAKIKRHAI
ncbi:MAG: DUF3568 family protein [Candidatus Omnitrophica bacterium]|nr:DUF3568 family protein [Candidatus Omnitrophota bacterium]